jgi:hypothetical protein
VNRVYLLQYLSERYGVDWIIALICDYSGVHPNIWTEYNLYSLFAEKTGLWNQFHLGEGELPDVRLHCMEQSIWSPEAFCGWRPAAALSGESPGYFLVLQSITAHALSFEDVRAKWIEAVRVKYPDYP